jgi:hypothetical protein
MMMTVPPPPRFSPPTTNVVNAGERQSKRDLERRFYVDLTVHINPVDEPVSTSSIAPRVLLFSKFV